MNCIKPNIKAKKYQPHDYKGFIVQPHPNAASIPIYGVRKPSERLFCAGPFATAKLAEEWIDLATAVNTRAERGADQGRILR